MRFSSTERMCHLRQKKHQQREGDARGDQSKGPHGSKDKLPICCVVRLFRAFMCSREGVNVRA